MSVFKIEIYLDSLPEYIETIDVSNKKLTYIPSLKRFHKLKVLSCHHNKLTVLPELNYSLKKLCCSFNKLIILPELNPSLEILDCSNNQLTMLPELNPSLKILDCGNNQLTMLPELDPSLDKLNCSNNQLTMLPELNNSLQELYCYNKQLPKILNYYGFINDQTKSELNNKIRVLNRVRFNIMCWKYKRQFRDWLWVKVRLPMTQRKYNPEKLISLLENIDENDEETFNNVIESW